MTINAKYNNFIKKSSSYYKMGCLLQKCVNINNITSIFSVTVCLTLIASAVLNEASISLKIGGICIKYVKTSILKIGKRWICS